MKIRATLTKMLRMTADASFLKIAIKHGVVAAVEHLPVIRGVEANTLIDIGANKGQFSVAFRALRPQAKIVAFEPLPQAAAKYLTVFRGDPHIQLHRVALSDRAGVAQFHVTDRPDSSSLFRAGAGQNDAFGVRNVNIVDVDTGRLDQAVNFASLPRPVLMKIDVQGGELKVLEGCTDYSAIDFIYVELSFVELYENQPLFDEVNSYLCSVGFRLTGVFNQVETDRFGPTQVDCLYANKSASGAA